MHPSSQWILEKEKVNLYFFVIVLHHNRWHHQTIIRSRICQDSTFTFEVLALSMVEVGDMIGLKPIINLAFIVIITLCHDPFAFKNPKTKSRETWFKKSFVLLLGYPHPHSCITKTLWYSPNFFSYLQSSWKMTRNLWNKTYSLDFLKGVFELLENHDIRYWYIIQILLKAITWSWIFWDFITWVTENIWYNSSYNFNYNNWFERHNGSCEKLNMWRDPFIKLHLILRPVVMKSL